VQSSVPVCLVRVAGAWHLLYIQDDNARFHVVIVRSLHWTRCPRQCRHGNAFGTVGISPTSVSVMKRSRWLCDVAGSQSSSAGIKMADSLFRRSVIQTFDSALISLMFVDCAAPERIPKWDISRVRLWIGSGHAGSRLLRSSGFDWARLQHYNI